MVMFDTLCRRYLPPYGNPWVIAPNFRRLAERTVQFQNAYVGSMPCMPARREIHTGRYNFLHRSWGPLEPFDDSMPELLARAGVHTHKVTDHQHYWEDGGCTYHNRYSSYAFVRGQEGDPFIGFAGEIRPGPREQLNAIASGRIRYNDKRAQDHYNRRHVTRDEDMPQHRTFSGGLEFIRRNAAEDHWFCQIETFDPHEPFFVQDAWRKHYPHGWDPADVYDWPGYHRVVEGDQAVEHIIKTYAALVTFCDHQLGRVLDCFDELDLWRDTLLIVNTDHGFLMKEHDWWGKCRMPFWQEIAHIPLWLWDPRNGRRHETREAVVQTMDIAPTLLDFFGQPIPPDMLGTTLAKVVERDRSPRESALYGIHGGHVNCTDGRYVYMRGPMMDGKRRNGPLFQYTHMPTHMHSRFAVSELQKWEKHPGFAFTKGCPVMQIPCREDFWMQELETRLYDLASDYGQLTPLDDPAQEARMTGLLVRAMQRAEAPPEQYERLGLTPPGTPVAPAETAAPVAR